MFDETTEKKDADFGFIGFDLWQVKGSTIFDNVIATDDKAEADAFVKRWKALSEVEKAKKRKRQRKRLRRGSKANSSRKSV